MVSTASMFFLIISIILSFGVPIGAIIYFRKRYKISFLNILVGAGIFIFFVMVLERSMHLYILKGNPVTSSFLNSSPWLFAIYGAFAAGIFEEGGRFFAYKFFLKGRRKREDGISYGIGHGGIEAILIGGFSLIQSLYFSLLINGGTLHSTLGGKVSKELLDQISSSLTGTVPYLFMVSGIERTLAFIIQVSLSLVVLYGIKTKKYIYLIYAILLHAMVDFPAGLYQKGIISNVWLPEIVCIIFAVLGLVYIKNWNKSIKTEM